MLSSANLNLEGALISLALMLFFGAGTLYTIIAFIVNSIQKKAKSGWYYLISFLVSGFLVLLISVLILISLLP